MTMRIGGLLRRLRKSGILSLAAIAVVAFSFRSAVADWNDVPTGSMKPTILIGDRIFVNKLAYDLKIPFTRTSIATWSDPARGDVVTCWSPADGARLVKRVVGVPGDTVEMRGGRLLINGESLEYRPVDAAPIREALGVDAEGKIFFNEVMSGVEHVVAYEPARQALRTFGPIEVPAGKFFMLGDNRDNSGDSRIFGFVDRGAVTGKVTAVALSLDYEDNYRPRWQRFFSRLI